MDKKIRILFGGVALLTSVFSMHAQDALAAADFTIWDAFTSKAFNSCQEPNMQSWGIQTMRLIYGQAFFDKASDGKNLEDFNETKTRTFLKTKLGANFTGHIAIDIEHLCLSPAPWCTAAQVQKNIQTHVRLAAIVKQELPKAKIGFYGNLGPVILGCNINKATDPGFLAGWQKNHDAMKPITDRVDFMVPSIYHNFTWQNRDTWAACATAITKEASRMSGGKPVYPFTKTRHNIWVPEPDKDKPLSYDYFLFSLSTLKNAGARGVAFWDGNACDGLNQWWPATKDFITKVLGGKAGLPVPTLLMPGGTFTNPYPYYTGFDVSPAVVASCKEKLGGDKTRVLKPSASLCLPTKFVKSQEELFDDTTDQTHRLSNDSDHVL